jgi:hypothetical protein
MTVDQVRELIRSQSKDHLFTENDHGITLQEALVPPKMTPLIVRTVRNGRMIDKEQTVWLVGSEPATDGYQIVMREDGLQFGLSSSGFPGDEGPILVGWYGSLRSAFLSM